MLLVKSGRAALTGAATASSNKNAALLANGQGADQTDPRHILAANASDVEHAKARGLSDAMIDRLTLNKDRAKPSLRASSQLQTTGPLGQVLERLEHSPMGLNFASRVPSGVG